MSNARTDEELMEAYRGGEVAAFDEIFARYAGLLLRVTRRHLENDDQAREVVQETFVRLHAARLDFRAGARLRPWIMTIAMNLVREHWRKKKRRKTTIDDTLDTRAAPTEERTGLELRQRAAAVRGALGQLPDSQRVVVELHWFQELPFAEVAVIVGTTEGAVRVRAHRAYQSMKRILGPELHE